MKQTIGELTIQYNRQERVWEIVGGAKPQRFQAGPVGKQTAIKFAIRETFLEVATAVDRLIQKNSLAAGRAWAAAQLLIGKHLLEPDNDAEIPCMARVVSQQNGRFHHYYINHQDGILTCTCPDYKAGGVVIGNRGFCKHALAFLLGRHLNWPLHTPEKPLPPDAVQLRRQAAGRWRGRIATGKTHLATALGYAACELGYKVRFFTAAGLINQLLEAHQQNQLSRLENSLLKQHLIIIDELGFIPFSQQGTQMLFTFISQRYQRGSLLMTTNLPFTEWTQVFSDNRLLGALLDRLTHHCHILEFSGESYRFRQSHAQQAGQFAPASSPQPADEQLVAAPKEVIAMP